MVPPAFHLLTRGFTSCLGHSVLALRLPAIVGFGLMTISLFCFVSRRCPVIYAIIAMLLPLSVDAQLYATMARPYGLVVGFCGLSLVCWQVAAESPRRKWALLGLAASLTLAVSLHYYSVLILVALALAELVRALHRRCPDWAMYAAMSACLLPMPWYLSFVRSFGPYLHNTFTAPTVRALVASYLEFLNPAGLACIAAGGLVAVSRKRNISGQPDTSKATLLVPPYEWVIVAAVVALPLYNYAIGLAITGTFISRYSLATVFGCAVLAAFLCRVADGSGRVLASAVLSVLVVQVMIPKSVMALAWVAPVPRYGISLMLDNVPNDKLPIVIDSPLRFLEMTYYASPELRARMYYVADPERAHSYKGSKVQDTSLVRLNKWVPLNVVSRQEFVSCTKEFLLYWQAGDPHGWIYLNLARSGADIKVLKEAPGESLLYVKAGNQSELASSWQ